MGGQNHTPGAVFFPALSLGPLSGRFSVPLCMGSSGSGLDGKSLYMSKGPCMGL